MAALDAVVTHHLDGSRSGVARFNEILARQLALPLVSLAALAVSRVRHPLLSFKVQEFDAGAVAAVATALPLLAGWDVFLHGYADLELERTLVAGARRVLAGNAEIADAIAAARPDVEELWVPGLLLDDRPYPEVELSVFSFGMAHKIRVDMFVRLRELLDATGKTYAVYVSAANHETASLADVESVYRELHGVFPSQLWFLGNLSDVAVSDRVRSSTFFASFFPGGARANNTSIVAAMERGAVVVTNLDRFSPPWLRHLETVIDLERCVALPTDPTEHAAISSSAVEAVSARLGWDHLAVRVGGQNRRGA